MEHSEKENQTSDESNAGSSEEHEHPSDDSAQTSSSPSDASESNEEAVSKKKKKKDTGLGTSRGVETMFRTSYRVHMNLSSMADAKANIMISINGIIISIIIASISPKIDTNPWLILPTSIMLLGALISIIYAVRAARPRVSSKLVSLEDVGSNRANILFFGHFSNMTEDDFVTGMSELVMNQTALYQNMIRDIYGLGSVLQRKYALLRTSYTMFMIALVLGISSFIAVYIWIVLTVDPLAMLVSGLPVISIL